MVFRQKSLPIGLSLQRALTTGSVLKHYGGTWNNSRRLQNPNAAQNIPTEEYVKEGSFKRTRLIYICGFGATGALGLQKFYKPGKKEVERLKPKEVSTNVFYRLPLTSSTDVISDVACGYGFTVIAAQVSGSSQTALGFGLNNHSQIGYHASRPGFPLEIVNNPAPIFLPTKTPIKAVACGRSHSLFLNQSGQAFALGGNSFGQCGRPIQEKEVYFGSKRVTKINLPDKIKQIFCGQDHSLFITEEGELYACGWGADGQTGLGHYENQHEPTKVKGDLEGVRVMKVSCSADTVLALDDRGNVFGWGNSEYAQFNVLAKDDSEQFNEPRHLKIFGVPGKIVDIAAGGTTCAVLNDKGQMFVWGFGILGKGPEVEHLSYPTLLPETLFGINAYNPDGKIKKIYAGLSQLAAITDRGDLYAWGRNRGGSLGFSHGSPQYFPMQVNMNLAMVRSIALGVDHSCAVVEKIC